MEEINYDVPASIYLLSFFHHKISNFIKTVTRGKLNRILSIIAVISPQTFINKCNEGVAQTQVMVMTTPNNRKFEHNFSCELATSSGQRPRSFKLKRFS